MPPAFDLRSTLAQSYAPLARGAKVRVYASADGRTVLKLPVSARELAQWFAEDGRPLLATGWAPGARDEDEAAQILLARTLDSYRLAEARLAKESGLIALHLEPGMGSRLTVDLGDRNLDADRDAYILQERAEPVRACIDRAMAAGDGAAARRILDEVAALIRRIWAMGIVEETANFHTNYGFAGNRLILLDIGELIRSDARVRTDRAAPKLLRKKGMAWLERKYPELAEHLAASFSNK